MKFKDWNPLYKEIISEFGYSEKEDKKAAEILVASIENDGLRPLKEMNGRKVEISGPYYSKRKSEFTIAAGSSLEQMIDKGIKPQLLVTDLDGNTSLQSEMNKKGIPVMIHAHGDNIKLLRKWAERFKGHVIPTCQCEPPEKSIYNFGGFTDGDRAAFAAEHFGAEKIKLNGWDFEEPHDGGKIKQKKLHWAKRLLKKIDVPIESYP